MITLKHNLEIDIATAHKRYSKKWKNKRKTWQDLVNRCAQTKRTDETTKEYLKMSREEQSDIKDVGGFVGGYLSNGTRKTPNVMYRTIATLDIDYGTMDVWEEFTQQYSCAAMLYSTHKHTKENPRFRLCIPFNRQVSPQEYEPICRRIAYNVGIELFDITTYQLPRLFYWPSTAKNGDFVFEYQDGEPLNVDEVLASYIDWRNVSDWPTSQREGEVISHEIRKAGDPLEKPGLIGAFCRAYTIEDAIEKFLPDAYERTATDGRYTYKLGSVAAGLVCYEGKFAYSHHETDPASKQLCNAFDLCRIHLFGVHDEGTRQTDVTKLPSYLKMQDFVSEDKTVRIMLVKERQAEASTMFEGVTDDEADDEAPEENTDWMADLECDKKGNIKSTAKNIIHVLEFDPKLKGHLWHDEFTGFDLVKGGLPWDKKAKLWGNRDDANLRIYLEEQYNITGKDKIKDAKDAVLTRHKVHPIREYLEALQWDGVPRLDKLIIDYIGAEDSTLNRAMTRKHFVAAVARVMRPGCKYDYCLIMAGAEGIGKSTLLNIMGGQWFSDSLTTMEGKLGMEQLRGAWLIELGELSSIKRSDVEQVKSYITRQDDIYRAAYGTVVEKHPRQCVFCGTTNETYFLKGDTGNRRFWVIRIDPDLRKHSNTKEAIERDRDQLWAEAVQLWRDGEQLYLPQDLEVQARARQQEFNDDSNDPLKNLLTVYLEKRLPTDWPSWDLQRRRAYYTQSDPLEAEGVVIRDRVCVAEFICEQMGRSMADKEYKYMARRIAAILDGMDGWERGTTSRHAEKLYGRQLAWLKNDRKEGEDAI